MAAVGLVGFAGVVVFGLLYFVFYFKEISLKLPVIGMAVFALVIAASVIVPKLEFLSLLGGGASHTIHAEKESLSPRDDGFPQLLLDKRGVTITATGLVENSAQGPALAVSIENRSETDVTVEIRDACVNGWMMDTSFFAAVAAGQKTKGSIVFLASGMERSEIETVAELEFSFHILNQNRVTVLDSDTVTIRTSAAGDYQYRDDGLGEELYRENGVRIVSRGFDRDASVFGPGLVLFMENTTDQAITVQARDVSVNGSAVDAISSEDVLPGKRSAAAVTLIGTSLQDNGIGEIKSMSFYLHVLDRDERATLFDTETFTIVV